jgi:uncharacterized protein with FMN-binding domain
MACASAGVAFVMWLGFPVREARGDTLELLNGIKLQGEVVSKTDQEIVMSVTVAGRTLTRKYPVSQVHAVTVGDTRQVLNERGKSGGSMTSKAKVGESKPQGKSKPDETPAEGGLRNAAAVKKLIEETGKTQPPWYEETRLNYPQTLDLSWPEPAPKGWNNQANVGQYLWDIINPNPNRWREGVKLLHHLLKINENDLATRARVMRALGEKYHNLLEDYPRAAFWWQSIGVQELLKMPGGHSTAVHLAECYWRLGNKQMAIELLKKLPDSLASIKLWADMGDVEKARQIAERARSSDPRTLALALLYVADGYRAQGQFKKALDYYKQVIALQDNVKGKDRLQRDRDRAAASSEAIRLFELTDVKRVADGTYQGNSLGYEGQVYVEVVVAGGKIEAVKITDHKEKQFYSALTDTPQKIIQKQGVKGVDATSSATITSEAIINATAKALAGANNK